MNYDHYLPRKLPPEFEPLIEMALDMRWSWNREADVLWQKLDPELWEATGNPWLLLRDVSQKRLQALAQDTAFVAEIKRLHQMRDQYFRQSTWFERNYGELKLNGIAFFCMEFGLSEALPIYSGGLGILAGDFLKVASDLGLPVYGIGLLYQQGYFRQVIGSRGEQLEFFPYNNPAMLPILPVQTPDGEWLRVEITLPGRTLYLRCWQVKVGRTTLFLLDANDPLNTPADRAITSELYGGGSLMRLQQEIALGIGGWRVLRSLGIECEICHLNEGHAAFAVLERARDFMERTGQPFHVALRRTRVGNIFTTHTPVPAGFDRFEPHMFAPCFEILAEMLRISVDELLALGRANPGDRSEPFNMAYLALRGCGAVNGVSALHRAVSRRIFAPVFPRWPLSEVPVGHVTNGIHVPSWHSTIADELWTQSCGKDRWLGDVETIEEKIACIPSDLIWAFRNKARRALVDAVRRRLMKTRRLRNADAPDAFRLPLDYDSLTLGFARRFTEYKRPNLLLHDPERLSRLLTSRRWPVQLIIAGKAHPQDAAGKEMIREWNEFMRRPEVRDRAVFVEDYDMALAAELVQGVDLWINTPRRPWEACGTSGMKLLVNGGLNLSELDGWWAEAYTPDVGWAIGDGREHGDDPSWDMIEAEALYDLLESEVVPTFYRRDAQGIPQDWVRRIRASMAQLTHRFSANRMVREYVEKYYTEALRAYRQRTIEDAVAIEQWYKALASGWPSLRLWDLRVEPLTDGHLFKVNLDPGKLSPDWLRVELYAEPLPDKEPERITMTQTAKQSPNSGPLVYEARVKTTRPAEHYTPRVIPFYPSVRVPLEASLILWLR